MLDLYIDRKAYYNLIRGKPLEDGISNDLFEGLVLALEEVGFRFIYLISDKLVNNISIKRYNFMYLKSTITLVTKIYI